MPDITNLLFTMVGSAMTFAVQFILARANAGKVNAEADSIEAVTEGQRLELVARKFGQYEDLFDEIMERDRKLLEQNLQIAELTARVSELERIKEGMEALKEELRASNAVIRRQSRVIAEQAEELQTERELRKQSQRDYEILKDRK